MMISELVKRDDKQLNETLTKLGLQLIFNKDGTTKVVELQKHAAQKGKKSSNDDV